MTRPRPSLSEVLDSLSAASSALSAAVDAGDEALVNEALTRAKAIERERDALIRAAAGVSNRLPRYATPIPQRDQVIRALRLGGRPMATRLLADVAQARYGDVIDTTRLASLRRDEASSWRTANASDSRLARRDVYVVPALAHDRLTPVRGTLALSSWPLATRIIAPASPRVDMLHITEAVVGELNNAATDAPWVAAVRRLVWRLGRTVAGAPADPVADLQSLRAAVADELSVIEPDDAREREIAQKRAMSVADEYTLMFGAAAGIVRAEERGA